MFTELSILVLILIWVVTVAYYDRKVRTIKSKAVAQLKRAFHEKRELQRELLLAVLERDAFIVKVNRHNGAVFAGMAKDFPSEAYELHVASVGTMLDVRL